MKPSELATYGAIAVGLGIFAVVIFPPGSKPPPGNLTITIDVVDSVTSVPISGAAISLGSNGLATDSNGVAVFEGISAGGYLLTVDAVGYTQLSETVQITDESPITVQLVQEHTCDPLNCGCVAKWDPLTCACVPIRPQSIIVEPQLSVNMAWLVDYNCLNGNLEAVGILENNPLTCPGNGLPAGWPSSNQWTFNLIGQVLDTEGQPLCEQDVLVSMQQQLSWSTPDGINGTISFVYPSSVITDASGNFEITVEATLDPNNASVGLLSCAGGGASGGVTQVLNTVSYRVAGTGIQSVTGVGIRLLVCANYDLNG